MIPTKEQERKALEQIKGILAGLGNNANNSYLLMAFQGCVEDAESNIENDFGDSWKDRAEAAQKKVAELEEKIKAAETGMEMAKQMIERLEQRTFTKDEMLTISSIIERRRSDQLHKMESAGEVVLENVANPESPDFKKAAQEYSMAKSRCELDGKMLSLISDKLG